jgi:T5SS/PEP-CTERM-associated repeat protein
MNSTLKLVNQVRPPVAAVLLQAALFVFDSTGASAAITSSGNVTPSPPQTAGADPVIGVSDLGRFTITPSSVVNSDVAIIGRDFTGIGYAVVSGFDTGTGSGAVWNTNQMVVGSFGTGSLEVLAGGVVTVDFAVSQAQGDLSIGLNPDSVGTVRVSGRGSLLRIGDETNIGHNPGGGAAGSGTLIIEDEGLVIATNDVAGNTDVVTIGLHGRIELHNGRLRSEALFNNGTIVGHGRIDNEQTFMNQINGHVGVGGGERLVINAGPVANVGFDNNGEVAIHGGEIEFLEPFINSNQAAALTLRNGVVHFSVPTTGFGFDSTSGALVSTGGINDVFGTVRIQGASSKIVVAGNSTLVFHDDVTNSGSTIEVFPGSTAVYLQQLINTPPPAPSVLSLHLTDPAGEIKPAQVEVVGQAILSGTLAITLSGGFTPAPGDQFTVLHSGGISGTTFDDVITTNPASGLQFFALYTPTDVAVFTTIAGEQTWGVDAGGAASVGTNWFGGVPPGGIGDKAAFTTIITANRTVTLDQPLTLGSIRFDDDNNYTIAGPSTLTLQNSGVQPALITVQNTHGNGAHTINAPLVIASDLAITQDSNQPLTIGGPLDAAPSREITKAGAGTVIANRVRAGALTVNGGSLVIAPNGGDSGTSVTDALAVNGTSRFDLNNNDLIVRSTAATKNAELGALQVEILSAQNGVDLNFVTNWDGPGITSSIARSTNVAANFDLTALGVIRNSDIDIATGFPGSAFTTFNGIPVTVDDVLVKYTYTGDGNLDGAVTFDDYAAMDAAFFGTIPNLGWATGDINFDNVINFDDYAVVDQAFFNQAAPLSADHAVAIPEPATWLFTVLATLSTAWFAVFRRKPQSIPAP